MVQIFQFRQLPFRLLNFFMMVPSVIVVLDGKIDLEAVIVFLLSIITILFIIFFCYDLCIVINEENIMLAKVIKGRVKNVFKEIEWISISEILTNRKKNSFYTAVVQRKDGKRVFKIIRLHSEALEGYKELMTEVLKRVKNAKIDKATQEMVHELWNNSGIRMGGIMGKLVKIINSPFSSNLEVVENFIIKLQVPYSDKNVTIELNSSIDDYREKADQPNIKIRQVMQSSSTKDTQTLFFDFESNKQHNVSVDGKNYTIELVEIGKENIEGQDFPFFSFEVTRI